MSKSVNVPTDYTIHTVLSGDVDSHMTLAPITTTSTMNATTDSKMAATTASTMAITQLPVIQLGITELPVIRFGMAPTRIHFPMNMKFAICALGMELLSFETCGESMVVIEDYVPHRLEQCS